MEPSEYYNIARLEGRHWWYTGMASIVAGWLRRLPATPDRRETSPRRILDAGCGTGGGWQRLAEFGRPAGVDLHPLALRLARELGCTALARADVQRLPFAASSFGLVTSLDVLYHTQVSDDLRAVREAARVLAPGGWLVLRVPAHEWLRRGHDRTVHTRHRYTRPEVRSMVEAAGLQPVRVTYANAALALPALLWRLARLGGQAAGTDVRLPPRPINAALAALLRLEGLWLRRLDLPVGMSVMALARKEA